MNLVLLTGRLTKDPETKTYENDTIVTKFHLAVDRKNGKNETDFIRITCFGKVAENCRKYLEKGSLVNVTGKIQTGSYEAESGGMNYTTDVIANSVEFLSTKKKDDNPEQYER